MSGNEKLNAIISRDECAAIVRKHLSREDVHVIRYKVSRASEDAVGYLGEYLILKATIKDVSKQSCEELSYFIKCVPLDNEPLRQFLEDYGIFEKECTIYTIILQELKEYGRRKWHPECYYTRSDVIVLENLVSLGYEHIDGRTKFSKAETEAVLKNLASMHANSIIYEDKTGKNIGEVYGKTLFETSIEPTGWLLAGMKDDESGSSQPKEYLYFVKSLPTRSEVQRKMLLETGIFNREVTIYEKLFTEFDKFSKNKWHPHCYFSRSDVLILEELTNLGYEQLTERKSFTNEEIKSVLKNLAAMHAATIIYETRKLEKVGSKFKEHLKEVSIRKDVAWFYTSLLSLRTIAKVHPKYQTPEYQKFLSDSFLDALEPIFSIVRPSENFRNVLCHGDIWYNNVFFKHNRSSKSVSSLLIDFQICRYAPPATDVLITVYVNTSKTEREHDIDEYLKFYYLYLTTELKAEEIEINDCITWQEFLDSCEYAKVLALVYGSIADTILHLPKNFLHQLKYDDPEKYNYFMHVSRDDVILENIKCSDSYKNHVFTRIEELVDYVYHR